MSRHASSFVDTARRKVAALARTSLPPGTKAVGIGLVVTGLTAYVYLVLTARVLGPRRYVPLSVLWAAVFIAGPGLFLPLQQEVGRLFAHRKLQGLGAGPILRRASVAGAGLAVIVLAFLAALAGSIDKQLFGGQSLLVFGFALALVGYLLLSLLWGALAGSGRFTSYALAQSGDGCCRLAASLVLVVAGVRTAGPYGLVLGLTPILAAGFVFIPNRDLAGKGQPSAWSDLSAALGWLLVGSVGAQLLANGPVIAIKLLASSHEQPQVGSFLGGLVISRIPLFLFGAVQAALLPRLTTLARSGRHTEFRTGLLRLLAAVLLIVLVATGVALAVGPEVLRVIFGGRFQLERTDLVLLAAGSGLYMVVLVVVQPLIALGMHARSALGWVVGLAVSALVTALGSSILLRVELGFLCGVLAALVTSSLMLWGRMRPGDELLNPSALVVPASTLEFEP